MENANAISYDPGYKTRTCVYTARAPIQVTWRSPTSKAPYFTDLIYWLLGFPALHQPLTCLPMLPQCKTIILLWPVSASMTSKDMTETDIMHSQVKIVPNMSHINIFAWYMMYMVGR
jgi:hypothetical protein